VPPRARTGRRPPVARPAPALSFASVELTATEQRVLGCLIEKEATTPEQYPLSMNALVAGCNQATNRDPVVAFDETTVSEALSSLREKHLIRIVYPAHARVTKYRQVLPEVWALTTAETAVLAVLLLRGAQTVNELTTRTERYADLADMGGVIGVLDRLAGRPQPLVAQVGRRPGQREERFAHLMGGPAAESDAGAATGGGARQSSDTPGRSKIETDRRIQERLDALEADTANLRRELDRLRELLNTVLHN
jgi:uncharacterized protein YceH (UPF0502 family)